MEKEKKKQFTNFSFCTYSATLGVGREKENLHSFTPRSSLIAKERCRRWKKRARVKKKWTGREPIAAGDAKRCGSSCPSSQRRWGAIATHLSVFAQRTIPLEYVNETPPSPRYDEGGRNFFFKSCKKIMIIKTGDIKLKKGQCLAALPHHVTWVRGKEGVKPWWWFADCR